jgi:peptide/nickel transport system permease protein
MSGERSFRARLRTAYGDWYRRNDARIEEFRRRSGQIRRNPASFLGLLIIAVFLVVAALAPVIAPFDPNTTHLSATFESPSFVHPFGTDNLGRDIFSRVIYGAQTSLKVSAIVVSVSLALGVPVGLFAGYSGGWIDEAVMRFADLFLGFPPLLLPLAISLALGGGLEIAALAIAITWWPWYARIARSQAVDIREEDYVTVSKGIGVGTPRILRRHVLPNGAAPILVQASMDVGYAILITSSLSFIGAGANPPTAEWGLMIASARSYFLAYWWTVTFPGLAIFTTVLGFNLFGDGLRDVLDPKLSRR